MVKVSPLQEGFGYKIEGTKDTPIESLDMERYLEEFKGPAGGVLLFRGFDTNTQVFREFTERFGVDFRVSHTNMQDRVYPDGDASLATVNLGFYAINFHQELTIPYTPKVIWMHCVEPAEERGRTGVVDGVKVLKNLTRPTRRLFREKGGYVHFENLLPQQWQAFFPDMNIAELAEHLEKLDDVVDVHVNEKEQISFKYDQRPVRKTDFSQQEAFVCGLLDYPEQALSREKELYPKPIVNEVTQAVYQEALWVDWQQGDILLVDNTRVMHAREAFESPQREILIRYSNLKETTEQQESVEEDAIFI